MRSAGKPNPSDVTIAKVARSQAIIVALVTTLGGSVAGYLLSGGLANSPNQRWLVIDRVEGAQGLNVRIVATVDGINYSYPSKAVWAEVGPTMAGEKFPLPAWSTEYRVAFSAFYVDEAKIPGLLSSNELFNRAGRELPTANMEYRLFPVSEAASRSPAAKIKVIFRIE